MVLTYLLVDGDGRSQLGVRQHGGHAEGVVSVGVDAVVAHFRVEGEGTLRGGTLEYKRE